MRPTIRSLSLSFCMLLGLATYSVANADHTHVSNQKTVLAAK